MEPQREGQEPERGNSHGGNGRHEKRFSANLPPLPFQLGRIVITPGALCSIPPGEVLLGLRRHAAKDWGNLGAEDVKANDEALVVGARVLSAYSTQDGTKFWIITEADRSCTTVLLPEEY